MKRYLILLLVITQSVLLTAQVNDTLFRDLKYRNIGPHRGGRSVAATGVAGDPLTYYMGTTGGGLWKTTDAGQNWVNISDKYFKTGSVGAVAVSESDPNVVYCGMGEHATRGVMSSYGDGVYKSTDAGKTWKRVGLEKTQHISRITIHPKNPDILYVAAEGAIFGPTPDRGVYRSTDGGRSWEKVLYVNELTGCAELSMDYSNPLVLYAAMWEHQRKPWIVISGGEGSGMYKTSDGGDTWKKIESGLPKELGKMAVSVCRSNPERVYAIVESDSDKEKGGLFVSNDGGEKWTKVSSDHRLVQRAWYYLEVFTDPLDDNTIYSLSAQAIRSIDGGTTWEELSGTHSDHHDLWINPANSKNIVIANDGGAAVSFNAGKTWSSQDGMPTGQFYRVSADNLTPYNLYGGQQDNTSVKIASMASGSSSITQENWTSSAGGESAFLAFDPDNPVLVMGGSYLGSIELLNTEANASTTILADPQQYLGRASRDMKYRFNWNAPIIRSQHEENTFYHAANVLLKTTDMGNTWVEVSPDLTRDDDSRQGKGGGPYTVEAVGAENYGTISYVIESPHEKGVIYTGSDDGMVYLTRDGGKNWTNITPKNMEECLVNAIEVSPHDPATAYIATTRYKFNDHRPGLFKTTNYGKSWTPISQGIPEGSYTRVVREDAVIKNLLFAGTETGVFISRNGGTSWDPFNLNLPSVAVTDLLVKDGDLVVATSGRAFWILDDLELVRQYDGRSFGIYQPADLVTGNWRSPMNSSLEKFTGMSSHDGINPANGVVIYYQLPDTGNVEMEIKTGDTTVRRFSSKKDPEYKKYEGGPPAEPLLAKKKGLNRFIWDTRYPTMPGIPVAYIEGSYRGHKASPGVYTIIIRAGGKTDSTTATILPNPLYKLSGDDYDDFHRFMTAGEAVITEMYGRVNTMYDMRAQLEDVIKSLTKGGNSELADSARKLVARMKEWDEKMVQRKSKAYDDVENFPNMFTAEYLFALNQAESSIPRVNRPTVKRMEELNSQWEKYRTEADEIIGKEVPELNRKLFDAGYGAIRKRK